MDDSPSPDHAVWSFGSAPLEFALRELPAYMMRQRWYPGKDAGLPALSIEHVAALPVAGCRSAHIVWRAAPPRGPSFRVAMPLALVTDLSAVDERAIVGRVPGLQQTLIDATALDSVVRELVDLMMRAAAFQGLAFHNTAAIEATHLARSDAVDWPVRRSRVEQSNTSIRVGTDVIVKLIRKLERGIHPELEMARYLSGRGFAATPALLGWIDAGDSTLAVMQAFVANNGDGWTWLLERLRSGAPDAGLRWLKRLGRRTAEMHVALAGESTDPAFAPEDIGPDDWQNWKKGVLAMSRRVLEGLDVARPGLDETTRVATLEYRDRASRLDLIVSRLLPGSGLRKTRHHGDYHLGQVLVHDEDASIVDFEGEPMRPLAARRAKHNALRDVAGMLRSLDYAAAVAGREGGKGVAHEGAWLEAATQSFLDAYLEGAEASPCCPRDRGSALRLVQFFTIEKALYEILYELANRPGWVGIPLRAVNRALAVAERDGARV
jgi:trehalose synthase-fused probable maltokinase